MSGHDHHSNFFFYCHKLDRVEQITSHTGKKYTVRQKVDCKSNDLVYIFTCTKCGQQYVGETKRTLGERVSEHLRDIRYTKHPILPPPPPSWLNKDPTPVGRHWGQSSHPGDDLKINILALINRDPQDDHTTLYREHIEYQWIHRLRTMTPFGINVKIDYPVASGC